MPQQHLPTDVDASGADAGGDILLERFVEGAALAPVESQHRGVLRDAGKRLADHRLRNAGRGRLLRHRGNEGVEIAAAAGGVSGGGDDDGTEENGPTKHAHANPLLRREPIMPWEDAARNLVVPADAGTHTPRPTLLRLWVPAPVRNCALGRDDSAPTRCRRRSDGPSAQSPSDRRPRHSRPGWR